MRPVEVQIVDVDAAVDGVRVHHVVKLMSPQYLFVGIALAHLNFLGNALVKTYNTNQKDQLLRCHVLR